MSAAANQPPPDIDALEARLAAALAERDTAIIERDAALRQNDRLAHLLRQLQRMQFGRRSEKLDPDQFALALEDIEQVVAAREAADDKQNKAAAAARVEKRRAIRGALPAHLPRVHVTIEPEDWNCPCCRSPMHAIGADVSERLDVVPAQFRVLVTHRPDLSATLSRLSCYWATLRWRTRPIMICRELGPSATTDRPSQLRRLQ